MIIYGIKNCDKVRAALKKCQADGIDAQLHDFRVDGIDETLLRNMLQDLSMADLLNKRSTTWKQLSDFQKIEPNLGLLVANPTLIKRPVIYIDGQFRIGL